MPTRDAHTAAENRARRPSREKWTAAEEYRIILLPAATTFDERHGRLRRNAHCPSLVATRGFSRVPVSCHRRHTDQIGFCRCTFVCVCVCVCLRVRVRVCVCECVACARVVIGYRCTAKKPRRRAGGEGCLGTSGTRYYYVIYNYL